MKVKVYCPCSAKFEFEVEPVHERMPVPISCPVCGEDATALANAVIQSQLAAAQPSAPPAAAVPSQPAAPPQPPTPPRAVVRAGLRINKPAPAPVPEAAAEAEPHAPAAPRPVPQRRDPAASPVWQKNLNEGELSPLTWRIIKGVAAALAVVGAAWFWYVWMARDPKVVYSLDFPKANSDSGRISYRADAFYQLIGPNRLLSVKNQRVSLMDVTGQSAIWSAPITEDAYSAPRVVATTNDIWLAWPGKLMRFDLQTGKEKSLTIPDPVISVTAGDNMMLVLSGNPAAHEVVTQFPLPDGPSQSEEITPSPEPAKPLPKPIVSRPADTPGHVEEESEGTRQSAVTAIVRAGTIIGRGNVGKAMSITTGADTPREDLVLDRFDLPPQTIFDAGQNAVWFQSRMVERREITVQAMKPKPAKSVLDSANVTASQGVDLAEEMANNAQRELTGGVDTIDVSRYQVTLHRLFAHDVPDWTGEIIGPPGFVPLKTVDLIVAGTNLAVFDKNNKKLWDAKLTYPAAPSFEFGESHPPPCLETADALYFADKGMFTRFDPATGNVRWRLTSVGISAVQIDDRGRLYLDTTSLDPGAIHFSQQINLRERDLRVLMQVDPATGKILWRSDFPGDYYHALVSGKFLYSARVWQTQDPLRLEEGPDTHFNFKYLEPSGKMVWNYPLSGKQLVKTEVQKNWILLQFQDQVLVLKFFSL